MKRGRRNWVGVQTERAREQREGVGMPKYTIKTWARVVRRGL